MNELQIHVPSEKSQTQRLHTTLFYLYDILKRQGTETEKNQWLSELRVREQVDTEKLFGVIELFSIALMVKHWVHLSRHAELYTNVGKFCCIYIISQ